MVSDDQKKTILTAVNVASTKWKTAFNSGDVAGCAAQYEDTAVMQARPFGTYTGTSEISGFWKNLIDGGFSDVEYINPKVEVVDETSAILTAEWKMNKAAGVIHKELWVLQADGSAKLRDDDFEARN